ncbi:multidrug efflux MFS transporter, partial [Nonomuraea sp. PA05]
MNRLRVPFTSRSPASQPGTRPLRASRMSRLRSPVVAAGLIAFALTLNLSAGNVILPAVERDLGITPAVSRWVVLGYALATVAFIPVAGRAGRRVGVRRAMVWGAGGFGVVSVVCAVAPEVVTLLAGRLVLAAFAALLTILTAVLAVSGSDGKATTDSGEQAEASSAGKAVADSAEKAGAGASRGGRVGGLAVAAVCATLGGFAGAAAGGGLVSPLGWRALLLLPVPLCLLSLTARLPDTRAIPPAIPTTSPTAALTNATATTTAATTTTATATANVTTTADTDATPPAPPAPALTLPTPPPPPPLAALATPPRSS